MWYFVTIIENHEWSIQPNKTKPKTICGVSHSMLFRFFCSSKPWPRFRNLIFLKLPQTILAVRKSWKIWIPKWQPVSSKQIFRAKHVHVCFEFGKIVVSWVSKKHHTNKQDNNNFTSTIMHKTGAGFLSKIF